MKHLLTAVLSVVSMLAYANPDAGKEMTSVSECSVESDRPTFVTSITTTRGGGEEILRLGTCDAGDPINIEYVDRTESYESFLARKAREEAERMKANPISGAGDDNYPAILLVEPRKTTY